MKHINRKDLKDKVFSYATQLEDTASGWMHDGKKLGNELYEDGMKTLHDMEKHVEEYSEDLVHKIRENPVASVLIAGGVGALLYVLLKKRK